MEEAMCKEGDSFYKISTKTYKEPQQIIIKEVKYHKLGHYSYTDNFNKSHFNRHFGKTLFKTKEEAMKKLEELNKIVQKRNLLKEYELKLNKELGIENNI